jgi:autotransporter passenger strand-loop-strand repeat protein
MRLQFSPATGGANQSVSITVGDIPATPGGYEEFEIHLRTDPTTGTGYEITWGYNHNYLLITTWNATSYGQTLVSSGQTLVVSSGQTSNNRIIDGSVVVLSGGTANASVISSGGLLNVLVGGLISASRAAAAPRSWFGEQIRRSFFLSLFLRHPGKQVA